MGKVAYTLHEEVIQLLRGGEAFDGDYLESKLACAMNMIQAGDVNH